MGETGPAVVSPSVASKARRDVVATLHELIDKLVELQSLAPKPVDSLPQLPLLLNAIEAGRLLSVSRSKILELVARGQIPAVRVGASVRIPRDRLVDWIDAQTREPAWLRAHKVRLCAGSEQDSDT